MRYQDLLSEPDPQACLFCPQCSAQCSASRGDYWMVDPAARIVCADCGEGMILATVVMEPIPYRYRTIIRDIIEGFWEAEREGL